MEQSSDLLTVTKAAQALAVHPKTVQAWIRQRRLAAIRTPGGHYRIEWAELERLLRRGRPRHRARPSRSHQEARKWLAERGLGPRE